MLRTRVRETARLLFERQVFKHIVLCYTGVKPIDGNHPWSSVNYLKSLHPYHSYRSN